MLLSRLRDSPLELLSLFHPSYLFLVKHALHKQLFKIFPKDQQGAVKQFGHRAQTASMLHTLVQITLSYREIPVFMCVCERTNPRELLKCCCIALKRQFIPRFKNHLKRNSYKMVNTFS